METPENVIIDCLREKEEMQEVNTVVADIDRILTYIKSKSYDEHMKNGDLARLAWNLSVSMFNLGEMVAEYTTYANASYIYRKFKYYEEYGKLRGEASKMGVADSDKEADKSVSDYYERQLRARYLADLLSTKYDECNRMVMVLQSLMKQEKEERLRSDDIRA